jgi:TRAP-type mannitol/chloroaromatic compound transport system permease small subunit
MTQTIDSTTVTAEHPATVRIADRLRRVVDLIGGWASWLTCIDVIARKLKYVDAAGNTHSLQLWMKANVGTVFESVILQEMEWHFHAALFALVLGYGLIYNTHVRIDLIRENLAFRKKVWLEFAGLTFLMLPFCALVIWFALDYVQASYAVQEGSVSTVGLPYRWMIKSVLVFGLVLALVAGIAAWLQVVTILWGSGQLRFPLMTLEWPEEDRKIEGKERVKLEDEYGLKLSDDVLPGKSPS